ncbi:MAG TPA: glycosyltransferase family 2 protein [Syntrophorhabdaceae bacterium]|jgi:cellulose synthase/poly-beta-1,6-N-acetylglucosamine synthase-like glycosyltransferase
METLFGILIFLSIYSYLVYPLILLIISFKKKPWHRGETKPFVSMVFSAFNEEKVIEEKMRNSLALIYPKELFEIIVTSDGSTDRTNDILAAFEHPGVVCRLYPHKSGKTACLNRVLPEARGEIILFTDANSMFPSDMLAKLVTHFAGPEIGMVTGWTKYRCATGEEEGVGLYARMERWTKERESRIASCVGADGAVFAMRKSLFRPLSEYDINDFVMPMKVIEQGKRVVLDPEIFCFEESTGAADGEYHRQVRISTRTLGALIRNIRLLNPFKYGIFSFFLMSHKLMRFLIPFLLLGTFSVNILLLGHSYYFILVFLMQTLFFAMGLLSIFGFHEGRLGDYIKLFLITSAAQLVGWLRMLTGTTDTVWRTQR